jgi:hypothetical protein
LIARTGNRPTQEDKMTDTPDETLSDDDMTTGPVASSGPGVGDADGTDSDGGDSDGTDGGDSDGTDGDASDSDGTDGDASDSTDGDATDII